MEQFQRALDEQLLGERVADLHGRALARPALVEALGGQHTHAADAVATGQRAVQNHQVAGPARAGHVDVVVAHRPDAQRVDQRIRLVAGIEDRLAADIGQPQTVAITADTRDDPVHHAHGVRIVHGPESQLVHDRQRPGPHAQDVAHDAADAGGRALVGLDVARVVVGLDLEGHRPAVADVDDAGVLPDPHQQRVGLGLLLAELLQVHLAGLVRAVLAPHHAVHRQLRRGGAALQDVANALVLVGLQAEFGVRLRVVRGLRGVRHRIHGSEFMLAVSRVVAAGITRQSGCHRARLCRSQRPMWQFCPDSNQHDLARTHASCHAMPTLSPQQRRAPM